MSTPTNLFLNWTAASWLPQGGSSIPLNGILSVDFNPGGQLLPHAADGNRYPVALVNHMNNPSASFRTTNLNLVNTIAPGSVGTFSAILNDATNGAGLASGAIKFTLINAVTQNNQTSGQFSQYASGTVNFLAFSADGTTSPLAAVVQ